MQMHVRFIRMEVGHQRYLRCVCRVYRGCRAEPIQPTCRVFFTARVIRRFILFEAQWRLARLGWTGLGWAEVDFPVCGRSFGRSECMRVEGVVW